MILIIALLFTLLAVPIARSADVTTITVPDLSDPTQGGAAKWVFDWQQAFEKQHPEIKINHVAREAVAVEKRAEYWATQFQTGAQTMIGFDMIPQAMALARMGLCKPFDTKLLPEYNKIIPALKKDASIGGKLYVWPGFAEPFAMVVRRSFLKEAGLSEDYVPKTWAEFATMAQKMTNANHHGLAFFATGDYSQNPTEQFLWANGAKRATEDAKRKITLHFTEAKVVETVSFMKDLIYKYKVIGPNPAADWSTCFFSEFMAGKAAMSQWYPSWIGWAFSGTKFKVDDLTYFIPPKGPSGKPYTQLMAGGFAIGKMATPAQVRACTLYAAHMKGMAYYEECYKWSKDNGVSFVQPPPFTGVDWTKLATDVPSWWMAPVAQYQKIAITAPAPDDMSEKYWIAGLSKIYTNPNSDVKAELAAAQESAQHEWLDKYNAELK